MGPSKSVVEDVDVRLFGVFGIHHLDTKGVRGELAPINGVVHVLHVVVWFFSSKANSFLLGEILDARIGLDVPLDVLECAILLTELVGVNSKRINVPKLQCVSVKKANMNLINLQKQAHLEDRKDASEHGYPLGC